MSHTKTANTTQRTTRAKATTVKDKQATKAASRSTHHGPHDSRPSAKQPSKVVLSPRTIEDERTDCMRVVNLSLQTLSAVTQSGWKFVPGDTKNARNTEAEATKVDDAVRAAKKTLQRLREITPEDLDVERAACSITGKLITLELYEEAIQFLDDMHPRLFGIAKTTQSCGDDPPPLHLLSLPHPTSDDPTVLTLLITSITHALNALLSLLLRPSPPFSANALTAALQHSHSLLAWAPNVIRDNIPEKTRDALLTKAYTLVNKVCGTLSSSDRSGVDSDSIFHLRMYALSCLLYTTSGTIKSATFWDQVHKACLSHARTISISAEQEAESVLAARVSSSLSEIVRLARSIHEHSFLDGRSFVQMCETWMSFAQKGDILMLDHISGLMGIPCPSSSSSSKLDTGSPTSAPLSSSHSVDSLTTRLAELKISESTEAKSGKSASHVTKDAVLVECAQCCGIFIKATTSLDNEVAELARHAKEAAEAVHRYSILLSHLDSFISLDSSPVPDSTSHSPTHAELLRARGKLERALERLRRAGLRILDAQEIRNQGSRHAAMSLLEAIATALERALIQENKRTETRSMLMSLVDVFFALARTRLQPADVESYTPALSYLERAVAAVNAALTGTIAADDAATLLRCISGTLHNLGGTLYAAGRLGGAVRFLKQGCSLGRRVLTMYSVSGQDGQSDREKEGRQQLEEQLFRRYELLGVCHSKIGDRKLAYECFVDSVWTFPYTHHLPTFLSADPFAPSAPLALRQLSSIIERLTYAAVCELFLPPAQLTLRQLSRTSEAQSSDEYTSSPDPASTFPSDGRPRTEITGAVLMRQLATLENISHKDGVREAMGRVLEDLLAVYGASWSPVRRARVLVTALSVSWRDPNESTQLDVDAMGQEALALLAQKAPESESLAGLVPQLRVSANMWLALHAYRRSPAGVEMMSAVATHVEAAYSALCDLLPRSEGKMVAEAGPKGKSAGASSGSRARGATTSGVSKKGAAKSGKKAAADATRPRARTALQAVSLNSAEPMPSHVCTAKKLPVVFGLQPILGLIQMNAHLLGLLGLIVLKVKLLETLKYVCECQTPIPAQAYSVICVDLAHEYVTLGKSKRASALFNKCANVLKAGEVPDEVRLRYLLGRAEVLALGGNVTASASAYHDAQTLEAEAAAAEAIEEKNMPTAKRIRVRVERLERAALACRIFAAVQYAKDNVVGALRSMLQSLRLWNRAVDALARLAPPPTSGSLKASADGDANPFEVSGDDTKQDPPLPSAAAASSGAKRSPMPTPTDALSWRLLSHLVSTLFALAHAYHVRGSPREALYFVQQARDLAESARAPAVVARACVVRGEVLLGQGALAEGREVLEAAAGLLGEVVGIDAADAQRLRGDYGMMCAEGPAVGGGPAEYYERAWQMLDELERRIGSLDGGRRRSSVEPLPMGGMVASGGQGMLVPRLLSAILRRHIWLLRDDGDDVFKDLVGRLMALPSSAEIKGEEHAIMGKLTLHSVYERFRSDMFLSSLTESAIALPMGTSGDKAPSLISAVQDILCALDDADKLFWADLALTSRSGAVPHVREASVALAMIRALQSSLGKVSANAPLLATRLLDASSAITLHREMLEAIPYKLGDVHGDDLQWPLMMADGSALTADVQGRDASSFDCDGSNIQKAYWTVLEKKYSSLVLSPTSLLETTLKLPRHWTVIHIMLTSDRSSMILSRLNEASPQPVLFCVPLRGRRETEEEVDEPRLMLEDALDELREIIRLSDEGTRRAAQVKSDDMQARAEWWAERAALDKRLQTLLESIEFCWLGAFKTILSQPTTLTSALIGDLRGRLEKVFKRSLGLQGKKKTKSLELDDGLLACFSALSPTCRDEELEDVVYFMLDLYQFHGAPIAISEVDMDQVTVDLRGALEEHVAAKKRAGVEAIEDSHTFLVLDRQLQGIPWESLPVLRGQSVSRVPSMEFLMDRVRLAEMSRGGGEGEIDRVQVDARKTYYVLNPSGDLKGTEGRFSGWLREMHGVGWEGIVGRAPSEEEMLHALSRKDLVIYFGHGGGEQYVRSHKIRHLSRCAATMLWGCSSGALRDMGEYDRVGTPYNYMIAGCPTLVANLWDVTDRDIDKLTQGVFEQLGVRGGARGGSVVAAVARGREQCRLRYLTGAAPVVYGIPFYL